MHKVYEMRAYLLYLIDTAIFMDKSATYVDLVYLWYFEDFERIHEYNWGNACLVYLYSKIFKGCSWKMKHVTGSITLLTIIFIGLLVFVCHFHYIFATLLLMIRVFQHFSDLDPLALPVHLSLIVCTNLY